MAFPGLGISGYRSLNGAAQWIPLDAKVTIILGGNNSGKSNVVRLVHEHLQHIHVAAGTGGTGLGGFQSQLDTPLPTIAESTVRVHWPIDVEGLIDSTPSRSSSLNALLESPALRQFDVVAIPLVADSLGGQLEVTEDVVAEVVAAGSGVPWQQLSSQLTSGSSSAAAKNVRNVLNHLRRFVLAPPQTGYVPPARNVHVADVSSADWDFGGPGVIERLHAMKNPQWFDSESRRRSESLTRDLRTLLEDDELEWSVATNPLLLNVRLNGHWFALQSLGTGTEHAILILAARQVFPDRLLCLEEPDAHLHPRLQRRLMHLLREGNTAGSLIATHSSSLIDGMTDVVLAVTYKEGRSEIRAIGDPELFDELRALGYRASDLLQANAIIWVEGPSDRIYIKHWIKAVDPELKEGIDFSIMFYGGALLKRLSAAEETTVLHPTLVDLRKINQRLWIVMDSDRLKDEEDSENDAERLRSEVERVRAEVEEAGRGGTWVTDGYTVENYVPPELLLVAVQAVHPTVERIGGDSEDEDPMRQLIKDDGELLVKVDKVAVAMAVAEREAVLDHRDLRTQIEQLVDFVRRESAETPVVVIDEVAETAVSEPTVD